MEEKIITFSGDNQKLFSRTILQQIDAKTTLIVPETHNAILVKDGQMLQTLSSGRYFVSQFVDLRNEQDVELEVLFMSKTAKLKLLWGTPSKILMFDATVEENYKLGLSGDFEVQICDPRKFYLYIIGADKDLTASSLQERLMSNVVSTLESVLIEVVSQKQVPYNKISLHKNEISQIVLKALSKKLSNEYGVAVFSFNIANIIIDDEDLNRLSVLHSKKDFVVCSRCHAKLSSDSKFCSSCGQKLAGGKICPKCQAQNSDDSKFCSACGSNLE